MGETAVVKGDIICENIDLWGKVEGNIYVKDTLSLLAPSLPSSLLKGHHLKNPLFYWVITPYAILLLKREK